ncbi:MAG TPA: caspase family protein [Leptospiraceae bacterium]|nr:caspase family protein [Leptospirales bacterium]HMU83066.1 caspase family protein [Leptospiraceae bacterium]HMX57140.1 caspase family protein [Leptospiraceae bacterium]HNL01876.1 caspase family protein [Leptospiraceae bacterium]HNL69637.1 caspase family protein [Leptospiraceae bacterium]
MKKIVALIAFAFVCSLQAQTLHMLIVADTADASIGSSTLADLQNMQNKAREIASNSGMKLNMKVLKSPEFNGTTTLAAVQAINPGPNDTVFFYYSGHGYRTRESKTKWPNMYVKKPQPGLEFSKVLEILDQKNPRLVIALGDLCNSFSDQSERSANLRAFAELQPSNYKKLFVEFSGRVYASGSKPGQYSFAMEDGGAFTNQWLQALGTELRAEEPSWKRLMAVATKPIRIGSPDQATQDPIFELKEGKQVVAHNTVDENAPTIQPTNTVVQQEVTDAEEETEEYQEDELCPDLAELLGSLKQLDGALKPGIRVTRGDNLYNSLDTVNKALSSVSEAYGDPKLQKSVTGLSTALEANNLQAYKKNLGRVIQYFETLNQDKCSE